MEDEKTMIKMNPNPNPTSKNDDALILFVVIVSPVMMETKCLSIC